MRASDAGISRVLTVIGVVAVVTIAGLTIYLIQPGGNKPRTSQTTTASPNVHSGSVDLSKLPVNQVQTQNGLSYYVVPLNLTVNRNMSEFFNGGAAHAVLEYAILNYSWASLSEPATHSVELGITLDPETSCQGSGEEGSIFAVVTHIVTVLAKVTFSTPSIAGTFTYSYELSKFPLVTTIINNGEPIVNLALQQSPFSTCLPSTQVIEPVFTYQLRAPVLSGFTFQDWSGSGPGSYSGQSANVTLTIVGNVTETAQYG